VIVSVSVGSGPAFLAAAHPAVRDRVALLLSLGGYASAPELVRFFLTGDYAWGTISGHRTHDQALVRAFVDANADLIDNPALPAVMRELSPEQVVGGVRAPLVLIHGRDDPVVPFTESLRLAAAAPGRTTLVVLDALGHVGGGLEDGLEWRAIARLWGAAYRLVCRA